jgi:hypothetical protein
VGWADVLGSDGLDTLAVCLSDIHDHCETVVSNVERRTSDSPSFDSLDELLAQVQVQLALAVRNWRELVRRPADREPRGCREGERDPLGSLSTVPISATIVDCHATVAAPSASMMNPT